MDKVISGTKKVYIHNELQSSAFWFKNLVTKKSEAGERDGIGFEYMSAAIMIAFSNEANVNFIGYKIIPNWNEWASLESKTATVLTKLGIPIVWETRPLSSVRRMRILRDTLAHGKPAEKPYDEAKKATPEELADLNNLNGNWVKACSHEAVMEAYFDMDDLWHQMLDKSGLEPYDTLSSSNVSVTLIGEAEKATPKPAAKK